jgi:hypothetical protein
MKRKILRKTLLMGAFALTLGVGSLNFSMNTKAADTNAKKLIIKKVLNLPAEGVRTPVETFTFKFEKHSKNGKENLATELPTIANQTIGYTVADATDGDNTVLGKQVIKMSSDVLANINFPSAGQYTYRVTEVTPQNPTADMNYSKASYLVSIFTKTTVQNTVVVDSIQIKKEKEDNGTADNSATKTAYNPGTDNNGTGNNFVFNNKYDKKDGNNNPGGNDIVDADKKGFVLQKKIIGDNANLDERFTFKLKVEKPVGSNSSDANFKYYVVSAGAKGTEQTGAYGTTGVDVTLKHNDRVVFSSVLLGSKVSAEETVDGGYTQGIGTGSTLNGQAVTTTNDLKAGKVIGDSGDNVINFTNTQQTPTGILLNNLPFIVLALMAGMGIFFFVKNRREEEELEA